jgi:2-polyprenyl-6-methoxyphenol hydroxylase-like FAD-dependent oxidoreductase
MEGQTVQKDAYTLILEAIDAGLYKPGDRLVESELAERLGVSRTPVREALQRLETQAMLTRDGRSLIVASLDHNQLAELYAVRSELEGLAARLAALPVEEFEAAMTARSSGILGPLRLLSRRSVWPIISQIADRMSGPRTVLLAEAAHVVPPIGAQGLNMSLADLRCLLDLAEANRSDPGVAAVTEAYHRRRHWEVQARVTGIDLLNRASMVSAPTLRDLRAKALNALYSARPVRMTLMRAGLGMQPLGTTDKSG